MDIALDEGSRKPAKHLVVFNQLMDPEKIFFFHKERRASSFQREAQLVIRPVFKRSLRVFTPTVCLAANIPMSADAPGKHGLAGNQSDEIYFESFDVSFFLSHLSPLISDSYISYRIFCNKKSGKIIALT